MESQHAAREADPDEVREFLSVIGEALELEHVDAGAHFLDVGGDSLSALFIIDMISSKYGFAPEPQWFFECDSIIDLATTWSAAHQSAIITEA